MLIIDPFTQTAVAPFELWRLPLGGALARSIVPKTSGLCLTRAGSLLKKCMNMPRQHVLVIAIPPDLPQDDLNTPELFAKCLGHSFEVVGSNGDLLELAVGEVMGVESFIHSIWIETQYTKSDAGISTSSS